MIELHNKSILITGGAGFIGSHLVDRLIDERPGNLVVVDDFYFGANRIRNLSLAKRSFSSLKVHRQDATEFQSMKRILKNERIEVVFNLAVMCLPVSLIKPKLTYDTNVAIVSNLCELLRKKYFETLIHFSSSEAYGSALKVPMDETHPLKPTTPYGASKIASDHLILSYCKTFGVDVSIVRPFNTYGPRQNEGTYAGVIPLTIQRILKNEPPVIHGDGLQTRDYTYVTDVADAAVEVHHAKSTRGKVLNIASAKETSVRNLVSKIAELMNCTKPIIYTEPRPGDVRRFIGSNSLAKKLIDYRPKVNFEEGLYHTIDWYRNLFTSQQNSTLSTENRKASP